MTKLSAEAYAIVEGRHADPFHYLGLHNEGGKTVVRAFLPEASNVEAIDEHGAAAVSGRPTGALSIARFRCMTICAIASPPCCHQTSRERTSASTAISPCAGC